jgi:5-methylcytosine-specific restriction endonuclease McrA
MPDMSRLMAPKKKTAKAHNAQQRVQDAMDRGDVKKPDTCSNCGKRTSELQFAHSNYDDKLAGRWLCQSCHGKMDAKNPKGGGSGAAGTVKAK